jgi:hypothetical protein
MTREKREEGEKRREKREERRREKKRFLYCLRKKSALSVMETL